MIRQGDILLVPCDLPDDAQISNEVVKRVVLAEGEATGHAHVIKGSILTATAGGRTLLRVLRGAITHPDHDPVPRRIAPGWYEVIRQRVYAPASDEPTYWKRVED